MDWISFSTGVVITMVGYALFKSEEDDDIEPEEESSNTIFTGRTVEMSCQTCRKLKKHREIEPNLYQCPKCKREVDLR